MLKLLPGGKAVLSLRGAAAGRTCESGLQEAARTVSQSRVPIESLAVGVESEFQAGSKSSSRVISNPSEAFDAFLGSFETKIETVKKIGVSSVHLSPATAQKIRAVFPSVRIVGYALLSSDTVRYREGEVDEDLRSIAFLIDQYPDLIDVRLGINMIEDTDLDKIGYFKSWTDRQLSAITALYVLPDFMRHLSLKRETLAPLSRMTRLDHLDFGWAFLRWEDCCPGESVEETDWSALRLSRSVSKVTLGMDCRTLNFMASSGIIPDGTLDMRQNYPIIDILEHLNEVDVVKEAVASYRKLSRSSEICMGFSNEHDDVDITNSMTEREKFTRMARALAEALLKHGFSKFVCSWNQAAPQDEEIALLRPELDRVGIELVTDMHAWEDKWELTERVELVRMLTGFESGL